MISVLSFVLPYSLLLYFLIRSLKQPIYLLGVPFLMFFRYCIFFENVKIFAVPGRYGTDFLFAVWMIIFGIILKVINNSQFRVQNNSYHIKNERNSLDYIVIGLVIISIIDLIIVYIEYLRIENVFIEFLTIFSLFFGYFIVKDIFRHNRPKLIADFLFAIVLVNTLASCFYILHQGLHLAIYHNEEYLSEIFQDQIITRTFWFKAPLCFFSISYLLVFRKGKTALYLLLAIINLLALFISYTRSSLIIIVIVILLYYLLEAYKNKTIFSAAKNIILTCIIGLILLVAVTKIFPANTNYFFSRFAELKKGIHSVESNSLLYRFSRTSEIIDKIETDKMILGYGPVTEIQSPLVSNMQIVTWDLVWTGVIFRWGIVGLFLFILLYLASIIKAFILYMKRDDVLSKLALLLLLVIVSQVIESFISSTFLSSDRYGLGLWYLGMLSALILTDKNCSDSLDEGQRYK
jgi:hypothetical protein